MLSEALLVLDDLVDERLRMPALVLKPPREAIKAYLAMLTGSHATADVEAPPRLREAGIPLREDADVVAAAEAAAGIRRRLRAVLRHQGWACTVGTGTGESDS